MIQFSEDVGQSLSVSDFVITGVAGIRADGATGTIPRVDSYSYNAATRLATLTLNQSLDPSTLTLLIASANISDVSGNRLDGEWKKVWIPPREMASWVEILVSPCTRCQAISTATVLLIRMTQPDSGHAELHKPALQLPGRRKRQQCCQWG